MLEHAEPASSDAIKGLFRVAIFKDPFPEIAKARLALPEEPIAPDDYLDVFEIYKNYPNVIEAASIHLSKQNNIQPILLNLFVKYLAYPGDEALINMLLKHHSEQIKQLHSNPTITRIIPLIKDPRLVMMLAENGFTIPKDKLIETYALFSLNNDVTNMKKLEPYVEPRDRTLNWPFVGALAELPKVESKGKSIYGSSISQEQYHHYMQQMIDQIVLQLIQGNFKIIPSDFNTPNLYQLPEEFSQTFKSRNNGFHERQMMYIEEKYKNEPNLLVIGAFRYWIAAASQSESKESFGRFRDEALYYREGDTATPKSLRYAEYFDKFASIQLPKYEQSPFLEITSKPQGSGALPNCTIIGFIQNEPIKLTSYQTSGKDISWMHTSYDNLPKILNYTQSLLVELRAFKHDATNTDQLIEKIATIHWWLSHACSFTRGSAAISEAITKAAFKYHGLDASWKIMLDCEALITPSVADFAKEFKHLITIKPLQVKAEAIASLEMSHSSRPPV